MNIGEAKSNDDTDRWIHRRYDGTTESKIEEAKNNAMESMDFDTLTRHLLEEAYLSEAQEFGQAKEFGLRLFFIGNNVPKRVSDELFLEFCLLYSESDCNEYIVYRGPGGFMYHLVRPFVRRYFADRVNSQL